MYDVDTEEAMSSHDESEALIAILAAGLQGEGYAPGEALNAAQGLYARLQRDYERAGKPEGDGHNSLMRWLDRQHPLEPKVVDAA
jgi:hypothetical protein